MNFMSKPGDQFDRLAKRVNVLEALRYMAGIGRENIDIGPALEVSEELSRQSGRKPNGIFVSHQSLNTRALVVGTATAGGHTVATDLRGLIELLRPRTKVLQAGATAMTGLIGNVAIPRQTAAATTYWVAEDEHVTHSQQAFDQVPMSPKTVGAMTQISRKMLLQSSIGVEDFVTRDLVTVIGLAIDAAAINGAGGNQPTGILSQTGVQTQTVAGAKPTWAEVVAAGVKIGFDSANAASAAFLVTAKQRADLMQTEKSAGSGVYVWEPSLDVEVDGRIGGWRGFVTNNLPQTLGVGSDEHAALVGIWSDLVVGLWSAVDISLDPYSLSTSGALRITAFQDVDVAVRHPESFCSLQWEPQS